MLPIKWCNRNCLKRILWNNFKPAKKKRNNKFFQRKTRKNKKSWEIEETPRINKKERVCCSKNINKFSYFYLFFLFFIIFIAVVVGRRCRLSSVVAVSPIYLYFFLYFWWTFRVFSVIERAWFLKTNFTRKFGCRFCLRLFYRRWICIFWFCVNCHSIIWHINSTDP